MSRKCLSAEMVKLDHIHKEEHEAVLKAHKDEHKALIEEINEQKAKIERLTYLRAQV